MKGITTIFLKMRRVTLDNGFQTRWLTTARFLHGRQKMAKIRGKKEVGH
jgi:hypothetical protein